MLEPLISSPLQRKLPAGERGTVMRIRNSWLGLVALSALAACSGNNNFDSEGGTDPNSEGGTDPNDEGGTTMDDSGIPLPKNPALAAGVTITQIAGYQTVKVPMMN